MKFSFATFNTVIAAFAFASTASAAAVKDSNTIITRAKLDTSNSSLQSSQDSQSNLSKVQSLRFIDDCDDDSDSASDSEESCDEGDDEYGFYAYPLQAGSRKRSRLNNKAAANAQGTKGIKKLRPTLRKHSNRTVQSKTTNKLITQLIQENINLSSNDQEDNNSKIALLWFKLANLILPYEKTAKKVEEELEKKSVKSKKVNIPNDQLVEERNVESRLVDTNDVPAFNVVDSDTLVQHNYQDLPEVNLAGLLGNLFGKFKGGDNDDCDEEEEDGTDDSCDEEEDDKYNYHDPCDVYETSVKMSQGKFANSTASGSNANGQNDTSTGTAHSNSTSVNIPQGVNVTNTTWSSSGWDSDSESVASTNQVYFLAMAIGLASIFATA